MSEGTATEQVWVWRQEDGFWRWTWACVDDRTGEESATLVSHRAFDSLAEARQSAQEAYPQLVVGGPTHEPSPPVSERSGRLLARMTVAVLVLLRRRRPGHPRPSTLRTR